MTTGRPPAPVPQEPVDPTARASLELPLLFQPHVDLEKTSGGGTSTEETTAPSHVNSVSQSQDSEVAGFEAITVEEPFRGYSFEVCSFAPPYLLWPLLGALGVGSTRTFSSLPIRGLFVSKATIFRVPELTYYHPLSLSDLNRIGIAMLRLCK